MSIDQGFLQAEKNINLSINPLRLQIGKELKKTGDELATTLQGSAKDFIIDPKQMSNWVKACMIDPVIQNYIYENLPIKRVPLSKVDELIVPKLRITPSLQNRFKKKWEQRSYDASPKHLNNTYRKQEQQQLEIKVKNRSLQSIVVNKISEMAFADLLDDIVQNILHNKKRFPTISSVKVYKANTFDDIQRKSDFMILIEHKNGKQSCLSIDLTTAKDEYVLARKDTFDTVSQTDFQSFLVDKYKHSFGNDKETFNQKVAQYQTAKINRNTLTIDKNIFSYFLRDYINFVSENKGIVKSGDALNVLQNLANSKIGSNIIKQLVNDISEQLSSPTLLN